MKKRQKKKNVQKLIQNKNYKYTQKKNQQKNPEKKKNQIKRQKNFLKSETTTKENRRRNPTFKSFNMEKFERTAGPTQHPNDWKIDWNWIEIETLPASAFLVCVCVLFRFWHSWHGFQVDWFRLNWRVGHQFACSDDYKWQPTGGFFLYLTSDFRFLLFISFFLSAQPPGSVHFETAKEQQQQKWSSFWYFPT